jgi:hypothetical protein
VERALAEGRSSGRQADQFERRGLSRNRLIRIRSDVTKLCLDVPS